ncbi:josephin-2 isoform X2 [Orussus abietinus]|uniref:josephin-2 isoform X2 n=1 Tax=Orussus abietinus TaxID=222816 RepID=UPI0006266CC0|nr:josephin-2 isoform X2 [Orussus abietinus]
MVTSTAFDMTGSIYHERQVKELCALHALNNLFQERGFSKQELDQICYSLSPHVWINPHKSLLGLGNYDINVIMAALQRKGREVVWFDKRRDPKCLCLDNIEGFILNVPTEYRLGFVLLPLKKRHWIALRKIHGTFYNLDSKLDVPQLIGTDNELLAYLKEQVDSKEKELFLVVSKEVDSQQGWLTETNGRNVDNNIERNSVIKAEMCYNTLPEK